MDNVSVGTHVTILMTGEDENEEYDIVGRTEADPLNGLHIAARDHQLIGGTGMAQTCLLYTSRCV